MKPPSKSAVAALLLASVPATASAHVGLNEHGGVLLGAMHPVGGLDHVAAMVAVGVYAAQRGGRALWALPCTFVATMLVGGVLGFLGVELPYVEQAIGLSVVALGVMVALGLKLPTPVGMAALGSFALFHGHAHGVELPSQVAPSAFAAGFVLATCALHALGLTAGTLVQRVAHRPGAWAVRALGAVTAVFGISLLA